MKKNNKIIFCPKYRNIGNAEKDWEEFARDIEKHLKERKE